MSHTMEETSARSFFAVLILLSVPFWLVGSLIGEQLLPGLPVSAFMVVCPSLAAALLCWREGGRARVRALLLQAVDWRRLPLWGWTLALCAMPIIMLMAAAVQTLSGTELPPVQWSLSQTLALFLLFLVSGTAEEIGWTGFATRRLGPTYGVIGSGLIVGSVAVAWHVIPLLQVERGTTWILWWALGTLSRRVLIVWLYLRGGQSVFGASLFHAMSNLSWMLFPVMGSHYDPMVTGVLTGFVTLIVVLASGRARRGLARS